MAGEEPLLCVVEEVGPALRRAGHPYGAEPHPPLRGAPPDPL